jgi:hypothetical protein
MSTATDLLLIAKNNGLLLSLEGENLRVRWQGVPPSQDLLASIKTHKPQLISLLAINDHHPQTVEVTPTWSIDNYAHLITCQQCEHLTDDDHCRVKPQFKPMVEAMRDCGQFEQVSSKRPSEVRSVPYSTTELNDLLSRYEKKLFNHLLECKQCDFEAARYCAEFFTTGSSYDAILLVFDDANAKREALLTQVIRARNSGRSVFGGAN